MPKMAVKMARAKNGVPEVAMFFPPNHQGSRQLSGLQRGVSRKDLLLFLAKSAEGKSSFLVLRVEMSDF